MRNLAGNKIGLIALRHRNQQIGVFRPRITQRRRVGGVTGNCPQIKAILQVLQAFPVAIDNRYVVIFGNQAFRNTGADLASAENDYFHFASP